MEGPEEGASPCISQLPAAGNPGTSLACSSTYVLHFHLHRAFSLEGLLYLLPGSLCVRTSVTLDLGLTLT